MKIYICFYIIFIQLFTYYLINELKLLISWGKRNDLFITVLLDEEIIYVLNNVERSSIQAHKYFWSSYFALGNVKQWEYNND